MAMKILAIDTTSDVLGLALADGARLRSRRVRTRGRHDERLFASAEALLRAAGLGWKDLSALAAASGPGSFTGIRLGLTCASVLAESLRLPLVAVNWFEAQAAAALSLGERGSFGVVFPASRGNFFFQVFHASGPPAGPRWITAREWPKAVRAGGLKKGASLFGPAASAAVEALGGAGAGFRARPPRRLAALDLIPPALERLSRGEIGECGPLYLQPAYYERSLH